MRFVWDDNKNRINISKHGISFETAKHVFDDPMCIEIYDDEHSADEERYIAVGYVNNVLVVIFTERQNYIRIISARLATAEERKTYYDENGYV